MILGWKNQPRQVLIIRKPGDDDDVNNAFKELAHWLVKVQFIVKYPGGFLSW
jgi:DNA gyrase inhibitor GyrI